MTPSYKIHIINTQNEDDYVTFDLKQPKREWIEAAGVVLPNGELLKIPAHSTKTVQLYAQGFFVDAGIGQAKWGKDQNKGSVDLRLVWQGFGIYALLTPRRNVVRGENSIIFPVTSIFPDTAKNAPDHDLFLFSANTELPEIKKGYPGLSILFAPKPGISSKNYLLEMHDPHSGKDYKFHNYTLINGFTMLSIITPWIIVGASSWGIEFECKIRDLDSNTIVDEFKYSFMSWEGVDTEMSYNNAGGIGKIEGAKHIIEVGAMDLVGTKGSKVFWPGHCTSALFYTK